MQTMNSSGVIWILGALLAVVGQAYAAIPASARYTGCCDASAAVEISANLFVAANDEDNILRLYRAREGGGPVRKFDLSRFLGKDEADLEGGTRMGNRLFWIGSHGRKQNGKPAPARQVFFATGLEGEGERVLLKPVGQPYRSLLSDLASEKGMVPFDLPGAATRIPKQPGALDIEGLCATPEGGVLIGFRSPVPESKALVVPLLNPAGVVAGEKGKFGKAILLDLGGLGIRDLAWLNDRYLVLGGPSGPGGGFRLWRWAGPGAALEAEAVTWPPGMNPEALVVYAQSRAIQVLGDEGARDIGEGACKDLKDSRRKSFGGAWVRSPGD